MHRGDLDETLIHGAENTRCQFETHSMTELGALKAEGTDFLKHLVAVAVTVGIPAGGKGKAAGEIRHRKK